MAEPGPDRDRWAAVADLITWQAQPQQLYSPHGRYGQWFGGGELNVAVNCVDRHLDERGDRPAIHWEGEPGDRRTLSYRQLHDEVLAMAAALRGLGVGVGDRVAVHLGWLPEAVTAMLACARIGAVFTVMPMPLPVEALAERLEDFGPKLLFTQDGAWRHGTIIPAKARADEALAAARGVQHTVVVRRTGLDVAWYEGDRWLHDLLARARPGAPTPDVDAAVLPADHPLYVANLANRRGRPVAVVHGAATTLASAIAVHRHGLSPGGVFWCAGDLSWLAAQAHGVIGPLAWGDTAVMFEGALDVPSHRRLWDLVCRYQVATLMTTPSVLARVRGWSDAPPPEPARELLRRVIAVSEPFDPALRAWVAEQVLSRDGGAAVGDAWGQIELGGVVRVDPPADPDRMPDPGLTVVDAEGNPVPDGAPGELVLRRPWAGALRELEGSGAPDTRRHWQRREVYSTGDRAVRRSGNSSDGRLEFLGRIDAVINLSGQLVSLSEVRDVLMEHPHVAAADVVMRAETGPGRVMIGCVAPAPGVATDPGFAGELLDTVRDTLGGLARPRGVLFVDRFGDDLAPEVRRRALAALAAAVGAGNVAGRAAAVTWAQVVAATDPVDRPNS